MITGFKRTDRRTASSSDAASYSVIKEAVTGARLLYPHYTCPELKGTPIREERIRPRPMWIDKI